MYDVTIIGGGIVGLATAYQLLIRHPNVKIIVLEKEDNIGKHQTGHNSGVIHSGIYYKPDTLKAKNCLKGKDSLIKFCKNFGVKYEICGKLIIATQKRELDSLKMLYKRGKENGISNLKLLSKDEISEVEPFASGISAILCPTTGIIDYLHLCKALSDIITAKSEISLNQKVVDIVSKQNEISIITETSIIKSRYLINCAGLFSDKIAKMAKINLKEKIIPFRGEYYLLKNNAKKLIKNLIYPVPDSRYPFLGVHFTRSIHNEIEAGPNAVLAFAREGYHKTDINFKDISDYLLYKGFWKMASKYWKTGLGEFHRSISKKSFVKSLQKLVPSIKEDDLDISPAGVRAQAINQKGDLIDDFVIRKIDNMIHVINAPSPAATSSLAIGSYIVNFLDGLD